MISSFTYTQDPTANEPIMFIDGEIGTGIDPDSGKPRIDGNEFMKELLTLDEMGKKSVTIRINSPGGVVTEGMAIYHAMQNVKCKVNTCCYGIAYSIAAVIFEGATGTREMAGYSSLMFHNPYQAGDGEMSSTDKKMLKVLTKGIINMITAKTGKTEEEIAKIMDRTTFLGAEEAKDTGFCDAIEELTDDKYNLIGLEGKELMIKANKVFNRLEPKIEKMEKICNLLKLNKNTSEDGIYEAVQEVLNKAKKEKADGDSEMDKLKAKLAEAEKKCDDIKKEMDDLKKKNAADAEALAKKEADAEDKKMDDELMDAKNKGKIKEDAVATLKTQFKGNFEGLKKTLDALAPSKTAASFDANDASITPFQRAVAITGAKVGSAQYYNLKKQFNNK